jgi:hypothetical protein
MLGRDDRGGTVVKVLDLGIAKMVGADVHAGGATSLTVAGQLLGTPYYMSPEQWGEMPRDGNPEVDGRTDIYSLGMIFFELVAGQKPLGGRTLAELRQKHVSVPMPSLASVAQDVPEEFGGWVGRAMSKDRADRPQTAGELIDGLRSSLGLPERGRSPAVRYDGAALDADGRGQSAGHSATGRVSPETNADAAGHAAADTIVTSEFDSQVPSADRGRETSARSGVATSGKAGARYDASRETIVERAGRTSAHDSARSAPAAATHGAGVAVVPAIATKPPLLMRPLVLGGAVALGLLLLVCSWFWLRGLQPKDAAVGTEVPKPTATGASNVAPNALPNTPPDAPKVEAASYWFETFEKSGAVKGAGQRVAEPTPTFVSKQAFRLHFMPKERGFLYIIGPNSNGNAQTTFLTTAGGAGLKSNRVDAGADFAFPSESTVSLDPHPGTDGFTFIFSPEPLMEPAFLAARPPHELTTEEVAALEKFRAQFKSDAPTIGVGGDGAERRVAVSVPATAKGHTLIFDFRIDHK